MLLLSPRSALLSNSLFKYEEHDGEELSSVSKIFKRKSIIRAHPTIKNNEKKTALDLALCMEDPRNKGSLLKLEYPQVIEQLMQAESDWLEKHTDLESA